MAEVTDEWDQYDRQYSAYQFLLLAQNSIHLWEAFQGRFLPHSAGGLILDRVKILADKPLPWHFLFK